MPFSAIYIMVCGWLAAFFFRDLHQTLIKEILEFSFLVPVVVVFLCVKMSKMFSPKGGGLEESEVVIESEKDVRKV